MKASLFEIFKIFFITGIQLLGGGYVILPLLKKYLADERGWMSEKELADFFAASQCLPGIIAGNIAVCAGFRVRGILGAIAALAGIIIPCIVSIVIMAHILTGISDYPAVQNAFKGIRVSVIVLLLITIKDLWKNSVNSVFTYILFSVSAAALFIFPVSPAVIVTAAGISALAAGRIKNKGRRSA